MRGIGLRDVVGDLRGGFVLLPGAITLGMAGLALVLSYLEKQVTPVKAWSDVLDRIFPPEPEAAHVVLGTIAGSMITVVSVVYSILLVVLTFASAQFSPRVLVAFVEDRVSQTTLGMFVGTFTYCLLLLPAVRGQPTPFVPSIAVIVSIVLAVACLVFLLFFIHHIAISIQASHIVDRVARETERVLDALFAESPTGGPGGAVDDPSSPGQPILAATSGYIRTIDERSLLAAAHDHDALLQVGRDIGQFVMAGTPILEVHAAGRAGEALRGACLRAFTIGPARTMDQDLEFGILQVVDIALKAISPAVNDPTTALTCIDQLGRILLRAGKREPPSPYLRDGDGRVRVVLRRTSFPRLIEVAFTQIGHYGRTDVAVPLRMMRVLGEVASATPDPDNVLALRDQARRLAAACGDGFPEADRAQLEERLALVEQIAAARGDSAKVEE